MTRASHRNRDAMREDTIVEKGNIFCQWLPLGPMPLTSVYIIYIFNFNSVHRTSFNSYDCRARRNRCVLNCIFHIFANFRHELIFARGTKDIRNRQRTVFDTGMKIDNSRQNFLAFPKYFSFTCFVGRKTRSMWMQSNLPLIIQSAGQGNVLTVQNS